ncbi:cas4, CRISPR-associated protein Cas4 [uncultured Caudovirales phage]|uniref:Cas4, CRISPR-associated protein Cas4 n=1 Tax=uncultured Caudovirales phage TaxID=2100421 RepID=A0A6J5N139_9CAUD|nr:cas4, CRISPR-associated protein Cas4 [uncultured Caudovirales phage]CAB4151010.1 cas4, CRISPR-associated protein Cas4 [uncultured Caudovirales phage]CAB4174572.1 cas4, CRISPR-associated protein Cas4 [uncultured Caudovirales phage]CAB4179844.1 cas4, CRISPR-associated protein Cas4 [uncultured Caudovirales phage]CAB4185458.1 cas4, CRISPR-associated protein Cas4 [uncultured Caudovirales phage]
MARKIIGNLKFQKPLEGGFDANEFAKIMEEAYGGSKKKAVFTQKKTFSPSTIGYGHGNCPRYWFIAFTGADFEEQFDSMARANMDNGSGAHDRIQKAMDKTGMVIQTEREIKSDSPPIRGFADVIIEWEGKEVVGEIKTAKDESYSLRRAEMKPSPNHLLQILTYMKINKSEQGFMFYENKNTQEFLIIPINMNEKNEKIINNTFDWLNKVYNSYQESLLPNRVFLKTSYACTNCPVKKTCWKELSDGDVEIEGLTNPK